MRITAILNRRSIAGYLYFGVAAVSGLLSSLSVLTYLPKEESGFFFLCQAMIPFLLLFDFGLLAIGSRELAFASGRGGDAILRVYRRFRDARLVTLIPVILVLPLYAFLTWVFPELARNANLKAIGVSALGAAAILASYGYQSFLEGTGNYHLDRLAATTAAAISGILIVSMAYFGKDVFLVICAWYAGQLATLVMKITFARRIEPEILALWRPGGNGAGLAFRQSFSTFFIQLSALVTKSIQYPIITQVLGLAALSTYFFVTRISATIDQIIGVLSASQRAIFSQHIAAGRMRDARSLALAVFLQISVLSVLGALALAFLVPLLLRLFMHQSDLDAVPFSILAIDLVCMCTSGMMTQFVIASGRNPFPMMVALTGVLTIALVTVLLPRFGISGAALGQFIANACTNLWFSAWHFARLMKQLENPELQRS